MKGSKPHIKNELMLIVVLSAIVIGYLCALGSRYEVMGRDNEYLFDTWKKQVIYKSPNGIYDLKGIK